jgi:Zn-dependent membrane protease YugP
MWVLIPALLIMALVFGPGLWVRAVMSRYSKPDDRYSGTGAELARHLLDKQGLGDVGVELTEQGDHYDPTSRTVRLSPANHDTGSLTAIAVAAHEVGHAVQHQQAYAPLDWRSRLVNAIGPGQKFAAILLMASPFVSAFTRVPVTGLLTFAVGFLVMGLGTLVHLITLPTEVDASFGRALPMLKQHNILIDGDEPHARRLLKAAAATYAAASLMSLLNIARWFAILRR